MLGICGGCWKVSDEIKQLVEAIGNVNEKHEALALDFLLFKVRYETARSKNGAMNEIVNWSSWARQFIVALAAALAAIVGVRLAL